ncbi:MAG: multicopper oxidase domain-containing protein [Nitrospirota bacterium]|nr:multicopper oxidase domain-containing protein [Nitrospirota bacterium]
MIRLRSLPWLAACLSVLPLSMLWTAPAVAASHHFEMTIEDVTIQVADGVNYRAFAFNGQVPGPLIHVREGDEVNVKVTNLTALPHTVHWHGMDQKNTWKMDGVPGITQKAIEPGDSFTYTFIAEPTGSMWYHCHVNVHEHVGLRGMWGPMIVDPKEPTAEEKKVTRDLIMMFSTYDSRYAEKPGYGGTPMDESGMDYFALNGRAFPLTQPIRVEKGDVLRLRLYGAGGSTHNLHTHGHSFMVTHKDGHALPQPYRADTISVGPGERYDIMFEANNPGRFIMHDHVDTHVTNAGQYPGGVVTVMEYAGVPMDDWYAWKDKVYDPNYFYGESMKKPLGMHNHTGFKGVPVEKPRRRGGK